MRLHNTLCNPGAWKLAMLKTRPFWSVVCGFFKKYLGENDFLPDYKLWMIRWLLCLECRYSNAVGFYFKYTHSKPCARTPTGIPGLRRGRRREEGPLPVVALGNGSPAHPSPEPFEPTIRPLRARRVCCGFFTLRTKKSSRDVMWMFAPPPFAPPILQSNVRVRSVPCAPAFWF